MVSQDDEPGSVGEEVSEVFAFFGAQDDARVDFVDLLPLVKSAGILVDRFQDPLFA